MTTKTRGQRARRRVAWWMDKHDLLDGVAHLIERPLCVVTRGHLPILYYSTTPTCAWCGLEMPKAKVA